MLGTPVKVAAAGLIGGALLAWRARSLRPGAVVIGTVAGAVLAETAISVVVYRPPTEAEIQASPLLSTEHHSFPSGHVAGIGALLGIIAVCIAIGRSRIVQALATVLVGAGVVIVAFSRLYLGHHWLSDVIGGALLAGVFVILGTVALTTRCDQSVRARSAPRGTPTITNLPSSLHGRYYKFVMCSRRGGRCSGGSWRSSVTCSPTASRRTDPVGRRPAAPLERVLRAL